MHVLVPFDRDLDALGELPQDVRLSTWDGVGELPAEALGTQLWAPPFLSAGRLVAAARQMPDLRVVQLLSAGADAWIGRLPDGVLLCDGRGIHTGVTAEWVLAATLGALREIGVFAVAAHEHRWARHTTDQLAGKRVLVVGAGSIGEAVRARMEPFGVRLTRVASRARARVHGVDELPALLPDADVVVLVVPLTEATTGLVDAAFLAALPDGALLVNAARGPVVDTAALLAELVSGRLRAALDVTDPEPLPADHPLWDAPGLLLTPHVGGAVVGLVGRAYALLGDQIRRAAAGEELINVVTGDY